VTDHGTDPAQARPVSEIPVSAVPASALLAAVTNSLPAGEDRPGQRQMAAAIATAITSNRHLVVAAGTGTGKTLAYLVPVIEAGVTTVVVTATMALQDQLARKDLPAVAATYAEMGGGDLDFAVLKGRSNYICQQRVAEMAETAPSAAKTSTKLDLGPYGDEALSPVATAQIQRLTEWAQSSITGELAELDWSPSDQVWRAVSVGSDECPGADRCPKGDICFAERARNRASTSDIIVVNAHLYGMHIRSGGSLLPQHEVVIFDEAHVLEDVISDTIGVDLAPGRFLALAGVVGTVLVEQDLLKRLTDAADTLKSAFGEYAGQRLTKGLPESIRDPLADTRVLLGRISEVLIGLAPGPDAIAQKLLRAQTMLARIVEAVDVALGNLEGSVAFISGREDSPRLEIAPLDVGPALNEQVWEQRTAILTSATIPGSLERRLGLPANSTDALQVESPFDYPNNSILYCALHLPDPRDPGYRAGVHSELIELITAAGGRTLALFTSWAAMTEAAEAVRTKIPHKVLTQRDLPKPALIAEFLADESTCLFATAGFFQGVDIPGRSLSLVTIDRLPFPRPDDPLLSARRDLLGPAAFAQIDLPRASMMLAQAAGRLIRTAEDKGVVAVFDKRLGTARYRWEIISALPPMRRTRERSEAVDFLRLITQ
jgi:ATP-dependent DNA helicase DinG